MLRETAAKKRRKDERLTPHTADAMELAKTSVEGAGERSGAHAVTAKRRTSFVNDLMSSNFTALGTAQQVQRAMSANAQLVPSQKQMSTLIWVQLRVRER